MIASMRARAGSRRGQAGMTLVETMLAVTISSMMLLPIVGWAGFAMREQRDIAQRNLSGASVGVLRTVYVRDVAGADAAWVDGPELRQCVVGIKGERTLLMLGTGAVRTAYTLLPDDAFTTTLWRVQCAAPNEPVATRMDLASDVIQGGTSASCNSGAELAASAAALGATRRAKGTTVVDPTADSDACRRVTLQLTTSELSQLALTASLRTGGGTQVTVMDPPTAVATATPVSGPRRLTVQFDGKSSTDPEGGKLTYQWSFGDGTTSTEVAPRHAYTTTGNLTATLTVTATSGLSASTSVAIAVADNAPTSVIAAPATGTTAYRGQEISFSSAGSNDDLDKDFGGKIVGYAWSFGDGTTSTDANPKKAYSTLSPAGGYTVSLAVTDDAGQVATSQITLTVANRLPSVTIVADKTSGTVPLTVDFSSVVVDETSMTTNPALTYAWSFGDGGTSTLADPAARTYSTAGTKTVTLTVTDDQNAVATASVDIQVNAAVLSPPTGLKKKTSGTSTGKRYLDLQFNAVTGAAEYEVQITCTTKNCTESGSATGTATTLRISGLQNKATNYNAQVRVKNSTGQWSAWSATVAVTT